MSAQTIVIEGGGFSKISGLHFRDGMIKNGESLVQNLFHVQEVQRAQGPTSITAKILRTTNIRGTPYNLSFELDSERTVVDARCSCVAGVCGHCKHGAALYFFINHERPEGKTDQSQAWKCPSDLLQARYPKGESIQKLLDISSEEKSAFMKECENPNKVKSVIEDLRKFGLEKSSIYKSLTIEKTASPPAEKKVLDPRIRGIFKNPLSVTDVFESLMDTVTVNQANFYQTLCRLQQ